MTSTDDAPPNEMDFSITRHRFIKGDYAHPPSGRLEIRVVRRGSSQATIDLGAGGRRVFTRPGDVMLSLPDRATRFSIVDDREVSILDINPLVAAEWLREAGGGSLEQLALLSRRPVRSPLIAILFDRLESLSTGLPSLRRSLGIVILAECLQLVRIVSATDQRGVVSRGAIDRLIESVAQQLEQPISAETLAGNLGISRRTFSATFKEATGLPFHQYVLRMRVDRAVQLLRTTDLSLSEIALRCGFAHQAHMSRMVSRLKGEAPGTIRLQSFGNQSSSDPS